MTDLPDSTRWQLWIVAFGFFMQSLDTTIVNTALPSMAQSSGKVRCICTWSLSLMY
ncbi:Multidrug transporter MdtD [Escherichia coli IS29]|nr:Multidrug transporter MdtD [Klebsiella pneumoniae IS22]CDK89089.1 Multidrug transporter MdtD [Escherichia coli IS29]